MREPASLTWFHLGYRTTSILTFFIFLLWFLTFHYPLKVKDLGRFKRNSSSKFKVVCYYTVPLNVSEPKQLQPFALDPYLCTHIIVGFAQVINYTIHPSNVDDYKVYKLVVNIKKINPNLKVFLSVGEQTLNDKGFIRVVSSDFYRKKFAKDSLDLLLKYGFDGLDIDWEFPSWPVADPYQRSNFTLLLMELKQSLTKKQLTLTVAVAASENIMDQSYDIQGIIKEVDFVNLMAYDYHLYSAVFPVTGPNSPIYSKTAESGLLATLNMNWSAGEWVLRGTPKEKLVVGIPTYGHSFKLLNEDNNGWGAPAVGFGSLGKVGFTQAEDSCNFTSLSSTTHLFDDEYQVPYAFSGREWLSYENDMSVILKANYIRENNFGGAMIYSLNSDDFLGKCGKGNFGLTRKVSSILIFS